MPSAAGAALTPIKCTNPLETHVQHAICSTCSIDTHQVYIPSGVSAFAHRSTPSPAHCFAGRQQHPTTARQKHTKSHQLLRIASYGLSAAHTESDKQCGSPSLHSNPYQLPSVSSCPQFRHPSSETCLKDLSQEICTKGCRKHQALMTLPPYQPEPGLRIV